MPAGQSTAHIQASQGRRSVDQTPRLGIRVGVLPRGQGTPMGRPGCGRHRDGATPAPPQRLEGAEGVPQGLAQAPRPQPGRKRYTHSATQAGFFDPSTSMAARKMASIHSPFWETSPICKERRHMSFSFRGLGKRTLLQP